MTHVTVYIPTKNRAELLRRAVISVLHQSYKNFEVIVVNDNSTDNTSEVILELLSMDTRVRCFNIDKSVGACAARNVAIENARGELITGLDDDDQMLPSCLEVLVKHYDPTFAFVCALRDFSCFWDRKTTIFKGESLLWENFAGNQVLCSTSDLQDISGFDVSLFALQDWDVWIRLTNLKPRFLKLNMDLYKIDRSDTVQRISTSPKRFHGYESFFLKHGHRMSKFQKANYSTRLLSSSVVNNMSLLRRLSRRIAFWKLPVRLHIHEIRESMRRRVGCSW